MSAEDAAETKPTETKATETTVVQNVANALEENAELTQLGKVCDFLTQLEQVKTMVGDGPGNVLEQVECQLEDIQYAITEALNDPSSLSDGSQVAKCGEWYATSVASKLQELSDETKSIMETATIQSKEVAETFSSLDENLEKNKNGIDYTAKRLTSLPEQVRTIANAAQKPSDLRDVDTEAMENACNVEPIDEPLNNLEEMKTVLSPCICNTETLLENLQNYIENANDKVKDAFKIPNPLCLLNSCGSTSPQVMTNLLEKLDSLKAIDFQPLLQKITSISELMSSLDVETVKTPLTSFAEKAKEQVDILTTAVKGAKASFFSNFRKKEESTSSTSEEIKETQTKKKKVRRGIFGRKVKSNTDTNEETTQTTKKKRSFFKRNKRSKNTVTTEEARQGESEVEAETEQLTERVQ
mmetsp:Transcript_31051/g.35373  ORF Transcript_31051/g.35373 Transcript_31051/m.35373 type:complete len:413 (+) Transcript_31051:77-1315(+)|eukprot:CAMPEP_0194130370 /NCGR_PEP_ID=MMETSP0152-20130528/1424_1 /TAXON_ID=1049557 /ORGANISM="Thalassiothrix antarctica, Strain L6-D1" /LENGTH=412 /DNA_ID=CAMNT_0038824861 /DNA_START=50 /DNA_END=1288 /DNA_ORIENTATION=-